MTAPGITRHTKFKLIKTGFLIAVGFGIMLSACAPQKRYLLLSFFFDGVPRKDSTSIANSNRNTNSRDTTQSTFFAKEKTFFHEPYVKKKCKDCHAENDVTKFSSSKQTLCLSCHKDEVKDFKYAHGPAVSAGCYFCHDPHKSKHEKLLAFGKSELCFQCHESNRILQTKFHVSASSENCTECHSPHGSTNRYLLTKGTCYKCHSSFESEYKFIHGPVAGQHCSACHKKHNNVKTELTAYEQDLCLYCHQKSDILNNPVHNGIGDGNCMMCHNPHGGNDRYLLN